VAAGRRIEKVETSEDTIVFDGVTHDEFVSNPYACYRARILQTHRHQAKEITGRSVKTAARYGESLLDSSKTLPNLTSLRTHPGKVFYVELEGIGKFPVLHFGMTGRLQVGSIYCVLIRHSERRSDQRAENHQLSFKWHPQV
jgi:formamidopyrimidine-DNA glycosylase